ncbi:uncharacterized protein N7511_007213 [Penicillium nucicola]|uniref:uncharacterized protein n=1 Tax=Penicillium nucicola TaxID=1850975 RepID=UPI0025453368|nr:uncharacterized protein N7511_007213 [Penicillium nucicola]KAJ5757031.1 hypothetical protein N7511_007213 [Penicillium nucicola]
MARQVPSTSQALAYLSGPSRPLEQTEDAPHEEICLCTSIKSRSIILGARLTQLTPKSSGVRRQGL